MIVKPFTRLDDTVIAQLEKCAANWPYENKEVVERIKSDRARNPQVDRWVACETSFFINMPEYASHYAIPESPASNAYRRFGANGLYHEWIAHKHPEYKRIVSVYIGEQTSTASILNKKAVETSSGFSSLEGLPGMTTCGELDPSIPLLLAENGFTPEEIEETLYCRSGWMALTGKELTISQLLTANDEVTEFVRNIFFSSLIKMIGAMISSLGGVDAVVIGSESKENNQHVTDLFDGNLAFLAGRVEHLQIKREQIIDTLAETYISRSIHVHELTNSKCLYRLLLSYNIIK